MLFILTFLQNAVQQVKSFTVRVSKRMYRQAAVITAGTMVMAVVAFNSVSFGGAGKNAIAPEHGTDVIHTEDDEEEQSEVKLQPIDLRTEGQLIVGQQLKKEIQEKRENQLMAQAEIEKIKKVILMEAEEEARRAAEAAEEEARKAANMVSYTEQDYQVLLRIVEAEAGICDAQGKILVANVILNRVRSSEFPNNITDVVYERSQFSPVSDGRINSCKVSSQTISCVNRALQGEDYSDGALYFMNRKGARGYAANWFDARLTYLFKHEKHEFFK